MTDVVKPRPATNGERTAFLLSVIAPVSPLVESLIIPDRVSFPIGLFGAALVALVEWFLLTGPYRKAANEVLSLDR